VFVQSTQNNKIHQGEVLAQLPWLSRFLQDFSIDDFQCFSDTNCFSDKNSVGLQLTHKRNGAQVVILQNDFKTSSVNLAVRTFANDDTGVAHITEHIRMRRSKSLPGVPEAMQAASIGGWFQEINAETSSDYTSYYVLGDNEQQLNILGSLMLESALTPSISEKEFKIEGWRIGYEHDDFCIRGIVQKEVCGYEGSPSWYAAIAMDKALLPDTHYRYNFGGDPMSMLSLSYDQFTAFNDKFYHPANFKLIITGSIDPSALIVDYLELLSKFSQNKQAAVAPLQARFEKPVIEKASYPYEAANIKIAPTVLGIGFLLPEASLAISAYEYKLLCTILCDSPDSVLKSAFRKAGLSSNMTCDFSRGQQDTICFNIYNIDEKQIDLAVITLANSMQEFIDGGISEQDIKVAIEELEEKNTIVSFDEASQSREMTEQIMTNLLHSVSAFKDFSESEAVNRVKKDLVGCSFRLTQMIKDALLTNQHQSITFLTPSSDLADTIRRSEEEFIEVFKAKPASEQERLISQTEYVERVAREAPNEEALEAISIISPSSIPKPALLVSHSNVDGKVHQYNLKSQPQFAQLDLAFNLNHLPRHYWPYLNILREVFSHIPKTAARSLGKKAMSLPEAYIRIDPDLRGDSHAFFEVSVSCKRNNLLAEATRAVDVLRVSDWLTPYSVKQAVDSLIADFSELPKEPSADSFGFRAGGALSAYRALSDKVNGIGNALATLDLLKHDKSQGQKFWEQLTNEITEISKEIFCYDGVVAQLICADKNAQQDMYETNLLLAGLDRHSSITLEGNIPLNHKFECIALSSRVAHLAQVFDLRAVGASSEYDGALLVLAHYWETFDIWRRLRADGSAYRVNVSWSVATGLFDVESGYNPDPVFALESIARATKDLTRLDLSQEMLQRVQSGAMRELAPTSNPITNLNDAFYARLCGVPENVTMELHEKILKVTLKDLKKLSELFEVAAQQSAICVGGSSSLMDAIQRRYKYRDILMTRF
jgi:presequence protease